MPTIKSGTESLEGGRYWNAIIGEDPGLVLGPEHAEPAPKAGALAYPCTQCGAQLLVDGSTRTPTCQYCSTRIFLPDSLWSPLHPLPQAVPFYLWLDPERVAVRKKVRRADKAVVVYAILAWIWLITIMPILGGSLSWGVSGAISAVMVPLLLVLCIRSIDRGSVSQ